MDSQPDAAHGWVAFSPALHIGVPTVDRQHGALIAELNRLIADTQAVPTSELFAEVLSRLGRDLSEHFRCEERLFCSLGMPDRMVDAHMAAHGEILSQYVELNLDLMSHLRHRSRTEVLAMVRRWVMDHIVVHDLHIRDYLPS
jgi:hemerythrin